MHTLPLRPFRGLFLCTLATRTNRSKLTSLKHSSGGVTKTKASPSGQPRTDICSRFKHRDSHRRSLQDLLYTYTASISSRIPIQNQKQSPPCRCACRSNMLPPPAPLFPVPRLLHSSMHHWDPTGRGVFSCCCTISAFTTHTLLSANETKSCFANDLRT